MQDSISDILIDHDIKFYIKSRVKSVYSIYNKLNNGKKWNNIYDILAMRIIVDKVSDCYTAIGLIHAKYRPIPGRLYCDAKRKFIPKFAHWCIWR